MANASPSPQTFSGSIAQLYEQYLVPLIFEPYAIDLARRIMALQPSAVLEIAAGTGVVTRKLAAQLPAQTPIIATDLSQPMLDHAQSIGTTRPVNWQQADAMRLPFDDGSFDVVVCQFGAMFFPDKAVAFTEARRVLRPGGTFLFNVWDRLEDNVFAECVTQAMAELFPADPPRFLARLPHGYFDDAVIADALLRGGFVGPIAFDTVTVQSVADSARTVAVAYCQGTPLRNEIEARDATILPRATDMAAEALQQRFGTGAITGKIQARVITATRED
ncbi:class I SAM-dependent methyltransferase [Variovorax sp. HJSM1_2]|uniref:class I SAM-dependent methyltransferase n=1 Tax=Variovorax sp. HJSM1_2 TaxID=3366263 RepID=UPI003BB9E2D6